MHNVAESIGAATFSRTWNRTMLHELIQEKLGNRKLIVVANREPYIHQYAPSGIECLRPASGMASALHPIMMAAGGTWIAHGSGSADRATCDAKGRVAVPPEDPGYTLRRVFLDSEQERGFYSGLSNEGLWPLCHLAFVPPAFRLQDWEHYREVNATFAKAVLEEAGDQPALVFIQDYHFALLPRMLREAAGNRFVIAQFWHIPWPHREAFRAFPWCEELLDGLLGNDLLGFQIRQHCHNFLNTVDRGIQSRVDQERFEVTRGSQTTQVRPFPISIDFAAHESHALAPQITQAMADWRERLELGNCRLGVGLERLDYTKGIPERLRAFDRFLEENPMWRGRVKFAQVAVRSRSDLDGYRRIEHEVDTLVEQINNRWRTADWKPIVLLKEHFGSTEMIALHRLARFCIVSSLHDGMNLVAKEFVASRTDEHGVLILSQFAGAHQELPEALEINPFAIHAISDAIHRALEMSDEEQQRRMRRMRQQIAYNNVYRWAGKFLSVLLDFELRDDSVNIAADAAS